MEVQKITYPQGWLRKDAQKGFTLIELLMVFVVVGIMAAIALPSMLSQARRAREAGAISYVGSVNRAQQAYRLENTTFANNMNDLQLAIPPATPHYTFQFGSVTPAQAEFNAVPQNGDVKAFTGCVQANSVGALATTTATINEAAPGGASPASPPGC